MAIKFECLNPECKRKLSVKDELAGRKGKCPQCKKGFTVPTPQLTPTTTPVTTAEPEAEPLPPLPEPPRLDGPERSQEELDRDAAEALADEKGEDGGPVQEVTFECEMCGEKVTVKADLAGKRAPCPECRRIVKVPELDKKKKGPKDWRQFDRRPGGMPDEPAPEGSWGTGDKTHAGRESLLEAGVIKEREKPVPLWVKLYPWWMALVASILTLGIIGKVRTTMIASYENSLATAVTDYAAKSNDPLSAAAALRAAGRIQFLQRKNDPDSAGPKARTAASKAREHCDASLSLLLQAENRAGTERDATLFDLASLLLEFSAEKKTPAFEAGFLLDRDEALKPMSTSLRAMSAQESRHEAVRILTRQLIAAGQPDRALALASQGSNQPGERAELQAVAGLELYTADKKPLAKRASEMALQAYAAEPMPPVTSAVVSLALLLKEKPPVAPQGSLQVEDETVGQTEALAREGKLDEARKHAAAAPRDRVKYWSLSAIAGVTGEASDIDAAFAVLEGPLRPKLANSSPWLMFRLVRLASDAKMPADRVRQMAALIPDAPLRARSGLLVLNRELAGAKDVKVIDAEIEKIDAGGLGRLLAAELLCRHNVAMNSSWGNEVQEWKDARKAFGSAGVLQGRYPR